MGDFVAYPMNSAEGDFFPSSYSDQSLYPPTAPMGAQGQEMPNVMQPMQDASGSASFDPDHEPPLLEELEIDFPRIWEKTLAVIRPFRMEIDPNLMNETDLAGPLVYCFLFGMILLFGGKLQFNYVFGISAVACLGMYALLNLMHVPGVSEPELTLSLVVSVLGYCMLPLLAVAVLCVFTPTSWVVVRLIFAIPAIVWCTHCATMIFVACLKMQDQRLLLAYPLLMAYACYAVLTLF